ncbi:DUF6233 domain-containing protein [Streptomyces tanashiensis]|uniref:DUF6233 domain-containing protein n=1 Tax=Streptomyces tanashiensis TaxID=67367 RepID=A0ABY6QRH5_9ACTN|nr:DUF6233 domain-containing protein [Streptomyces tanashiensis]
MSAHGRPVTDRVHVGGCRLAAKHVKALTEDQVRHALAPSGFHRRTGPS